MAKQLLFFIMPKDIQQIISSLEEKVSLRFFKTGSYSESEIKNQKYICDVNALGYNIFGNHQSESFLVLATSDSIQIREKVLNNGSKRYFIDQELNENSIVLWPGGLFENRYIICGHIASVYSNDFSKRIISMISKEMRKYCTKIGNYYIGNEAYEYRTRYRFITMNIHEPLEYDFKICE